MDIGLTALLRDLESRSLLDKTLIVINTEFGRPAQFDSGGGRGFREIVGRSARNRKGNDYVFANRSDDVGHPFHLANAGN